MSLSALFDRPERGLWLLIAAQALFWTLAPALSLRAPPLDVVEMYVWGREGVVATFKHPNGPGLLLEAARRLTGGQVGWPAYLLSQVCIGVTFWAVFALGRELMDGARALVGTLLLTGVYFFSWVTPEFNHNVLQMPLWALVILLLWRATVRGDWLSWVLLGAFGGLGLWAKYSFAVLLVAAALWIVWDRQARGRLATPWPWLGLAVFAAIAAPQALWLTQNDFLPFAYAARRASDGGPLPTIEFLLTQVLNHAPFLILLLCAGFFFKRAENPPQHADTRARLFLLFMAVAPLTIVTIAGFFGAGMRASWGAPMFSLSGLIAVALLNDKFSLDRARRVAIGAFGLIIVVASLYFVHIRYGARFTDDPLRGNWPQASLSRAIESAWAEENPDRPLRIVVGDIWTAGMIGLTDADPPSVLINGDAETSPWIAPGALEREGYVAVWQEGQAPPALAQEAARAAPSRVTVRYPDFPGAPPLQVNYVIVPPRT